MSERSDLVDDTAIAVIATQGMRGLTHRAVDTLADLPIGSASNVHRTRDALIHGIADRLSGLFRLDVRRVQDDRLSDGAVLRLLTGPRRHALRALAILTLDPSIPVQSRPAVTAATALVLGLLRRHDLAGPISQHLLLPSSVRMILS